MREEISYDVDAGRFETLGRFSHVHPDGSSAVCEIFVARGIPTLGLVITEGTLFVATSEELPNSRRKCPRRRVQPSECSRASEVRSHDVGSDVRTNVDAHRQKSPGDFALAPSLMTKSMQVVVAANAAVRPKELPAKLQSGTHSPLCGPLLEELECNFLGEHDVTDR